MKYEINFDEYFNDKDFQPDKISHKIIIINNEIEMYDDQKEQEILDLQTFKENKKKEKRKLLEEENFNDYKHANEVLFELNHTKKDLKEIQNKQLESIQVFNLYKKFPLFVEDVRKLNRISLKKIFNKIDNFKEQYEEEVKPKKKNIEDDLGIDSLEIGNIVNGLDMDSVESHKDKKYIIEIDEYKDLIKKIAINNEEMKTRIVDLKKIYDKLYENMENKEEVKKIMGAIYELELNFLEEKNSIRNRKYDKLDQEGIPTSVSEVFEKLRHIHKGIKIKAIVTELEDGGALLSGMDLENSKINNNWFYTEYLSMIGRKKITDKQNQDKTIESLYEHIESKYMRRINYKRSTGNQYRIRKLSNGVKNGLINTLKNTKDTFSTMNKLYTASKDGKLGREVLGMTASKIDKLYNSKIQSLNKGVEVKEFDYKI